MFNIDSKDKAISDTSLSIRVPRALKERLDALAGALSQSTSEAARQALEDSLRSLSPEQAEILLKDYCDLNLHHSCDLYLSSEGTDIFYIGRIDTDGTFSPEDEFWHEDHGLSDLEETIAEELARQIEGGIEEGSWHWEDWPKEVYFFAFSDRSEEWRNALAEVAEAMHLGKCPGNTTFEEACDYADQISSLASGQNPFNGDEAYQEWQKECEAKGLKGWEPQKY